MWLGEAWPGDRAQQLQSLGTCTPEVSTSQTCQTCPKAARIGLRPEALENPSLELEGTCTGPPGNDRRCPCAYDPAPLLCATHLTPW